MRRRRGTGRAPSPKRPPASRRALDWLVHRWQRRSERRRERLDHHARLFLFATQGDPDARAWLATALGRDCYRLASRLGLAYGAFLFIAAVVVDVRLGWPGWMAWLYLILPWPLMSHLDRWRRRRKAWHALGEGTAMIWVKARVQSAGRSRVFQSYWSRGGEGLLELDHPTELRDAVKAAHEWWVWEMPVPNVDGHGRVHDAPSNFDVGLVRRDSGGHPHLLLGGRVYLG